MNTLTTAQQRMLDAITRLSAERGYPPTLRELGAALGIRSTNAVKDGLRILERKGFILRDPIVSRSIRLVAQPIARAG